MKHFSLIVAGVGLAALIGGTSTAQAHSAQACVKQIKAYRTACKFSLTARVAGMCIVTETLKACRDRKQHNQKFHK